MRIDPIRQEGYELLHAGAIALAEVERNGIRINRKTLDATKGDLAKRILSLREELRHSDVWKIWRRRFGESANITSRDQLGVVLFKEMGYEAAKLTESGRPSTDEEDLQKVDHPFVQQFLRLMKFEKALGTYLAGIEREIVGDRIHPVFNLHTARTYRSSCDSPNFQNQPVRDKEIAKIIRSCFIPSDGCVLVENDFKGIEVSVAGCYHKDPEFISYITTPGKDMHRDMAAQLFMLKPEEVSKDARYGAKNKFVFPQFYGDFYVSCARSLWDWMDKGQLKGPNGEPLRDYLAEQGIRKLGACDPEKDPKKGTFEYHVKEVENDFWNNRFMVYGQWRRDWYKAYLDKGFFDLLTGFRVYGSFARNSVVNYPVQGSAFHCLLWSLIMVTKELRRRKMKSKVVGQIHDSLIGDVRVEELRDYLEIVEQITTVDILKRYEWIAVPLQIEYEVCPPGGTWHDKSEVKFRKGRFYHPTKSKSTADPFQFTQMLERKRLQHERALQEASSQDT